MIKIAERVLNVRTVIITGSIFLAASAFIGWIDKPIFGMVDGYEIGLSKNLPSVISYGLLSIVLGILSLVALSERFRWLSIVAGLLGVFLSVSFFLDYSLVDSRKIAAINDLYQQKRLAEAFSMQTQPRAGMPEAAGTLINTGSAQERFFAAFKFISFGVYISFIGSLIIVCAFLQSGSIKRRTKIMALFMGLILFCFYAAVTVNDFIKAEYHRTRGDYYLSVGLYRKAADEYEHARSLDVNLEYMKGFRINSGKAYFFSGAGNKADYNFYLANRSFAEGDMPKVIDYIKAAALQDPYFSGTVGDRYIFEMYNRFGIIKYRRGLFFSAIDLWEEALKVSHLDPLPYFFLSRAYFDVNSFEKSIMAGERVFTLVSDKTLKSYVSANIADSYFKLGHFDKSRGYYLISLSLDRGSSRALMSLAGR